MAAAPPGATPLQGLDGALGQPALYADLLCFFDAEIGLKGPTATVSQHLPRLASALVVDAFHPFIRLGYGVEFGVASEIAAGLAYLACCGEDPRLLAIARATASPATGGEYLRELQGLREKRWTAGRFNSRYDEILENAPLRPARPTPRGLIDLSLACLEVFHATHDFFALHLVTASHAAHVCAPLAGSDFFALYSPGIAAGYLGIGAPDFKALPVPHDGPEIPLGLDPNAINDEHDIKIAYVCHAQSAIQQDCRYRWVAARYLNERRS